MRSRLGQFSDNTIFCWSNQLFSHATNIFGTYMYVHTVVANRQCYLFLSEKKHSWKIFLIFPIYYTFRFMHCIILKCAVWKFPPFLTGVLRLSLQALKCLGLAIHNNLGPGVSSFLYMSIKKFLPKSEWKHKS